MKKLKKNSDGSVNFTMVAELKKQRELNEHHIVQKLYQYATILLSKTENYPIGEVTRIRIEDSFGTQITINVKN